MNDPLTSRPDSGVGPGGMTGFANPSVNVTLSAQNGTAVTAMRSDAAPALDQSIQPTWTGDHVFLGTTPGENRVVKVNIRNTTAATNGAQKWSPALRFRGSGWRADTSASVQVYTDVFTTALQNAGARPTAGFNFVLGSDPTYADALKITWTPSAGDHANLVLGNVTSTLATNSTQGFVYVPSMAGTPTGVPIVEGTYQVPVTYDRTNNRWYAYNSGWQNLTASGANPSTSIGLTATNGVATTFMRSDAAPALNQSIAPVWTGDHTFYQTFGGLKEFITLRNDSVGSSSQISFEANTARGYVRLENTGRMYLQASDGGSNASSIWCDYTGPAVILSGTGTGSAHFHCKKALTDAATQLFSISLPTLKGAGGTVMWSIFAADATDAQNLSGITTFAVVNKGGVYTKSVITNASNTASAVSTGTLTASFDILDDVNSVIFRVTPSGSLTETTYDIRFTVENLSDRTITIL